MRVPTPNSILLGSASKGPGCAGPRSRGALGEHPVTPRHLLIREVQPLVERRALGAAQQPCQVCLLMLWPRARALPP